MDAVMNFFGCRNKCQLNICFSTWSLWPFSAPQGNYGQSRTSSKVRKLNQLQDRTSKHLLSEHIGWVDIGKYCSIKNCSEDQAFIYSKLSELLENAFCWLKSLLLLFQFKNQSQQWRTSDTVGAPFVSLIFRFLVEEFPKSVEDKDNVSLTLKLCF